MAARLRSGKQVLERNACRPAGKVSESQNPESRPNEFDGGKVSVETLCRTQCASRLG